MILRAYNANLRPVVIVVALLSAVWSLFSCISAFQTLHTDKSQGYPKLGTFAIVLGSIYAVTCGIEIFGVTAASLQRMWMARLYALLTVVSALAIVGAGLIRVIVHFMLKNELIDECTKIAKGDTVIEQFGFWGPTFETKLNQSEANTYCHNTWSHDSFVEIISFIIEIFITAFFSSLAFAYSHQLHDPASPANVTRAPVTEPLRPSGGEDAYPSHYNPPYLAYNAPQYAPPPGAPPAHDGYDDDDGAKLYGGAKPPLYSEDDLGTLGKGSTYGAGAGTDPFADFDGNHGERDDLK